MKHYWRIELEDRDNNHEQSSGDRRYIHADHVILALGAFQEIPQLEHQHHRCKVMCSNEVLSPFGIAKLRAKFGSSSGKICIIGGAHSAFSAAWLCIHGENAQFESCSNSSKKKILARHMQISPCSRRISRGMFNDQILYSKDHSDIQAGAGAIALKRANPRISITILHRSPVRVFYPTKREAEMAEYRNYKQTNRHGQIHAFAGLRGDAKSFFNDVVRGLEPRVRLCLLNAGGSRRLLNYCFDDAHVIVWATGYKSHMIPVTDESNVKMDLYGNGHGYGLPAIYENGEPDGSKGRADGISVYMNQGASAILRQILGTLNPIIQQPPGGASCCLTSYIVLVLGDFYAFLLTNTQLSCFFGCCWLKSK